MSKEIVISQKIIISNRPMHSYVWLHNTQCGNFRVFLPLGFYVKSIFADFKKSKSAILTILEALTFDFWGYFTFENVKNALKSKKIRAAKMVEMTVSWASK